LFLASVVLRSSSVRGKLQHHRPARLVSPNLLILRAQLHGSDLNSLVVTLLCCRTQQFATLRKATDLPMQFATHSSKLNIYRELQSLSEAIQIARQFGMANAL